MKKSTIFLIVIILIAFGAIATKPTNEQCIEITKEKINTDIYNSSSNNLVKGLASLFVDYYYKK